MKISGLPVSRLAAKYGTPLYVYDWDQIQVNTKTLKEAFYSATIGVDFYYAMKANCHPAILDFFQKAGFGLDCVSPGELKLALQTGVNLKQILFTANYESYADLTAALETGVNINLDDIGSLKRLLEIGKPDQVSFRINPGQGRGKYEKITTGGEKAKFGIPFEQAHEAYEMALKAGIKKFGAHIMTGSGVLDESHFPIMLELFLDQLGEIQRSLGITFEFIDMGGGLGIPYYGDPEPLDVMQVGRDCLAVFERKVKQHQLGAPHLALEPGRYLVGGAGYLVTQVTGIKQGYRKYVGVNAGFNILIRSALYGAEHPIIIDGKEENKKTESVDVCGQICENTDIFTRDRALPPVEVGDLLIFTQAGAYGSVLSMPYNLRFRAAEVAVQAGKDVELTRREELADYMNLIQTTQV